MQSPLIQPVLDAFIYHRHCFHANFCLDPILFYLHFEIRYTVRSYANLYWFACFYLHIDLISVCSSGFSVLFMSRLVDEWLNPYSKAQ